LHFDDQSSFSFFQLRRPVFSNNEVKLFGGVSSPEGESSGGPSRLINGSAVPILLDADCNRANTVRICDPNIHRRR
jgi:hypothetical protein